MDRLPDGYLKVEGGQVRAFINKPLGDCECHTFPVSEGQFWLVTKANQLQFLFADEDEAVQFHQHNPHSLLRVIIIE